MLIKTGWPFKIVDEDGNELLQEGWIYRAGRIVLQAVAKLARGLDLELDI